MDKLRAIQYFNRTAEAGSFAAAARSFDVTTPAVTQLVAALERSLGIILFHRTSRGISLTADGERYYEVARRAAADLHEVELRLGPAGAKPRGTLTVVMRTGVGHYCVMPHIARFLARFPDIEVIIKPVEIIAELDKHDFDVAVMTGWPPERDFVVRSLAQTRNVVCASPEYWRREGMPDEPEALREHHCLVFRSAGGALLDRWAFEKNGERRSVDVTSRLLSESSVWLYEAACADAGVVRGADFSLHRYLSSGLLLPVLQDWDALDAPRHFAVYRRGQRQSKMVRVFIEFLIEVFVELERERIMVPGRNVSRMPRPEWFGRAHGRQSAFANRKQRSVR